MEAGAYEFADTEQFLVTAESIVGPYVWGTYDILLLPPSFPYDPTSHTYALLPVLLVPVRRITDCVDVEFVCAVMEGWRTPASPSSPQR